MIVKAARSYIFNNQNSSNLGPNQTIKISLDELIDNHYINEIKDPGNSSIKCDGYIFITRDKSNNFDFLPYLECGNNYNSSKSITSGLMAWYEFNGDVLDSSGNNRHGNLHGSPILEECRGGSCYRLTSNSDFITIPHDDEISREVFGVSDVFTLSAWVYPIEWENWAPIINKATNGWYSNTTAGIWTSTGGFAAVMGANVTNNPSGSTISISNNPPLNEWHYVVAVADGTHLSLYINNNFIDRRYISSLTHERSENTQPITIGRRCTHCNPSFKGKIDDVRIYNRALTEEEIIHNYMVTK